MAEDWTFIEIGRLAEDGDQIAQLYWMALNALTRVPWYESYRPEDIHAKLAELVKSAYADPSKNS